MTTQSTDISDLVKQLELISRSLPSSIPIGTEADKLYRAVSSAQSESGSDDSSGVWEKLNHCFDRAFGKDCCDSQGRFTEIRRGPLGLDTFITYLKTLTWDPKAIPLDLVLDKLTRILSEVRGYSSESVLDLTFEDGNTEKSSASSKKRKEPAIPNKSSGRRPDGLTSELVELVTHTKKTGKPGWRCIATNCPHEAAGNRDKVRILGHSSKCSFLEAEHPEKYRQAVEAQGGESISAKLSRVKSDSGSGDAVAEGSEVKKAKQSTMFGSFEDKGKKKDKVAREELQLRVDQLILRLICVRGLVPEILGYPEWHELLKTLNAKIDVSTPDKFRSDYIPKEAVFVREKQIKLLSGIENLTCSFDGMDIRRKDTFYTLHAITPSRDAYLLTGLQGSSESHTAQWVQDKVSPVVKKIGSQNWAAVVSDSTNTTKAARRGICVDIPTMVDLDDSVHALHNTMGDISKLVVFKDPLDILKRIAKYFSKSALSTNRLLEYRKRNASLNDKVLRIKPPGGTRFGSLHTAAVSLLPNLEPIQYLVGTGEIKFIKVPKVQNLFAHPFSGQFDKLRRELHCYTIVVDPFIRSLWSLEAAEANASDVFIFWLAIAAYLSELFSNSEMTTGISQQVAEEVMGIFNSRYEALFSKSDIYFAAFLLDPRYPSRNFLKPNITITLPGITQASVSAPLERSGSRMEFPKAYQRLKELLKSMLQALLNLPENKSPERLETLFGERSKIQIVNRFKTQLEDFWYGRRPFNEPLRDYTSLEWWRRLQRDSNASIIAVLAIKIFSILVNSMMDERTNSNLTWFNSALRGNQTVETLIDMIQIGQWYRKHNSQTKQQERKRPVVGFRFIQEERLEKVREAAETEANACEADSEEEEDDDGIDIDAPLPPRKPAFEVDRDIDLGSPFLRDLLSTAPVPGAAAPTAAQGDNGEADEPDFNF
ncbi:hypothetical protein BT96DRAFT_1025171 [Gymnopus androsaceus JB14]|uniref:DUF659 domain-containing protein n=1 Tax=Gymnopus androsaceus JB14 TaxID=1447944 RepID=A0A6A4GVJ5_9AGAR|nr:hypothetical protein BT96DRAFT_1025171 [Gymnopus androsaceus JB14]